MFPSNVGVSLSTSVAVRVMVFGDSCFESDPFVTSQSNFADVGPETNGVYLNGFIVSGQPAGGSELLPTYLVVQHHTRQT